MSKTTAQAKLAVKRSSSLTAGDMGVEHTAAAGIAQQQEWVAAQAAPPPGPAAAAAGAGSLARPPRPKPAYDMAAISAASQSLPACPASSGSAGRPSQRPVFFRPPAGAPRSAGRGAGPPAGRGRGRGRPPAAGGTVPCPRGCGVLLKSQDAMYNKKKGHCRCARRSWRGICWRACRFARGVAIEGGAAHAPAPRPCPQLPVAPHSACALESETFCACAARTRW